STSAHAIRRRPLCCRAPRLGCPDLQLLGRAGHMTATECVTLPELTIVTVVIEKHYGYVARQISLIESLNPRAPWRLLVVDNASSATPRLTVDDPRCRVIPGVEIDTTLPENFRGSYHHAAALNLALRQVKTRYAVVLDPDLFVVYRDWIAEVLQHIGERDH